MTISEAANILNFPEEHIRLYIKQDLIPGIKRNTKEPDISEKELTYIKKVIVLRRLRWRFVDIAKYLHGKVSLHKVAKSIAKSMEKVYERKIRPDFLMLTKQIADEKSSQLDADRYIELINNSEELHDDIIEPELKFKAYFNYHFNLDYLMDLSGFILTPKNNRSFTSNILFGLIFTYFLTIIDKLINNYDEPFLDLFIKNSVFIICTTLIVPISFFWSRLIGARRFNLFVTVITVILTLTLICVIAYLLFSLIYSVI